MSLNVLPIELPRQLVADAERLVEDGRQLIGEGRDAALVGGEQIVELADQLADGRQ